MRIRICQFCDTKVGDNTQVCPSCGHRQFIYVTRNVEPTPIRYRKKVNTPIYSQFVNSRYVDIALGHSQDKYRKKFSKIIRKTGLKEVRIEHDFKFKYLSFDNLKIFTINWAAFFGTLYWYAYRGLPYWKLITFLWCLSTLTLLFPVVDKIFLRGSGGLCFLGLCGNFLVLKHLRESYIAGIDSVTLKPSWWRVVIFILGRSPLSFLIDFKLQRGRSVFTPAPSCQ